MNFSWMAWTMPTALFFATIVALLAGMGVLARFAPRNEPRVGVLGIATQRGDRLFLSLLGAAFIHLAFVGLAAFPIHFAFVNLAPHSIPLWTGTIVSLVYAALVFRFV